MSLYNLTRWADELPSIVATLRAVGAGFQADALVKGAETAIAYIRDMERAKAHAEAEFEAKRRDPARSVETYDAGTIGCLRIRVERMVIVRHSKASVWLSFGRGEERFSIRTGRRLGAHSNRHIDWSTTTHAKLLAAREALS